MKPFTSQSTKGFAMLFTVLIVSLMLTIAMGIASITFKQNLLSGLAKDSQIAFYQADAAVECGKYYDSKFKLGLGSTPSEVGAQGDADAIVPYSIQCGDTTLVLDTDPGVSYKDYFVYHQKTITHNPCFSVIFDKTEVKIDTDADPVKEDPIFKIRGNGYNYCDQNPRQVQRSFEYIY